MTQRQLPAGWVDRIFARFLVRYGAAWTRIWEGVPMDAVAQDWSEELAGFGGDAIGYALRYLPSDKPPTVTQFKELCNRAPTAPAPQIEGPPADPQRVAAALAGLRDYQVKHPKAWAHALKERELVYGGLLWNGRKMTKFQRDAWREGTCHGNV